MGFRRLAPFYRAICITVRSVCICWVIVSIVIGFIVNIIAVSVTMAGRRRANIGRFTIETTFIRAVTVRTVIRAISVGTAGVQITVVVTVPPILVRTVWPVIIRIIIGLRRTMVVLRSVRSLFKDGPNWFILCEWHSDPAMVIVYAGPLSRVQSSGVDVHQ